MDAGNLLKPMLARGELRCIGQLPLMSTSIEKDAALERRFQQVFVAQPTVETTISILRGLKQRYVHHSVKITDSALVAAYLPIATSPIASPDKAIDSGDGSGSAENGN